MDILAVILGIAIAGGSVFFIAQPLRRARRAAEAAESELDTLLARRESLFTQLRELDFDHATGKVGDADYAPLRDRLKHQTADVLRQIDALAGVVPSAEADIEEAVAARRTRKPARAEEALEAAIATRRKRASTEASTEAELEAAVAARRQTLTCLNCGKPLQAGDAFCSKCGAPVGTQVAR